MKSPTPHNVVFLEFLDEAEVFCRHYSARVKTDPKEFCIMSFHPSVKAYLLKRGLNAIDSFHFCSSDSHRTLISQLQQWTDQIRRECSIRSQGCGDVFVENLIFPVRGLCSAWLYRVEVM